jgi:alkanesulfonate monooxygenase SsuD/methylene tetrahydromethanopterin reductase-like flavin-dependent oxidoreductase (luciferase family)
VPTYFASINTAADHGPAYVEGARSAGRDIPLGKGQGIVRWPQIGETTAEAREAVMTYDADIFKHFYASFLPALKQGTPLVAADARREQVVDPILQSGLWAAGSVAEVRQTFVDQWKKLPAEYVVLIMHFAQMPADVAIRNLEIFMSEIKPALDEVVPYGDHED